MTDPQRPRGHRSLPWLLATLYLCWGSSFLAIELMVRDIPPLLGAGIRFTSAGVILGIALVPRRGWRSVLPQRQDLAAVIGLSILLITIGNGGVVVAQDQGLPSWLASLLVATIPVWVALLRLGWGPRPTHLTLWGTGIGLMGTVLLVSTSGLRITGLVPLLLALGGALGWAIGAFVSTRRGGAADPFVTTFRQLVIGGAGLLILASILETDSWSGIRWTASAVGGLLWLTLMSSLIALIVFYRITALSTISTASTYAFTNPVVAMFLSIVVLGVWPDPLSILAAPLVIIGVAMVVYGDSARFRIRRESRGFHAPP